MVRVLIAKPGLDGHDVGAKVVCRALIDAGMEVIYTGLRKTPEEIARIASDEDVDVVGLSVLSGAHISLAENVMAEFRKNGIDDVMLIVGGNIPSKDYAALEKIGVAKVFGTSANLDEIAEFIKTNRGNSSR
ncbi:MAG: cobalamin B12-binding domain-containing protein [Planctomycetes bacterium]|nr:cobalamin B12-binding domain-containing protein [Planctomycetota bacterium]